MKSIIRPTSGKEFLQIIKIARNVQPYLPFEEVALIKLVSIASIMVVSNHLPVNFISEELSIFKKKYYPFGFKENDKNLTYEQRQVVYSFCDKPQLRITYKYQPIEKEAFVMTCRACRDYLYNGLTEVAEKKFIDKLISIGYLLK